jgi:putative ABC transport system permease protein
MPPPPAPTPTPAAGSGGGSTGAGPVDLSPFDILLCVVLIGVQVLASLRLRLGLEAQLAVAALRCVAQLSLLGVFLKPIFELGQERSYVVLGYAAFMVVVASVEATRRPAFAYKGLMRDVAVSLALSAGLTIAYACLAVLRLDPLWSPAYVIPIFGMILGNATTGVSVGLNAALDELAQGRDRVERRLALGASRAEATRDLERKAVRAAMVPTINAMNVVGLVSIPGMMSGQILGGSPSGTAARYQVMVFFLLSAASCGAAVLAVGTAARAVVDGEARFRADRLVARGGSGGGGGGKGRKAGWLPSWWGGGRGGGGG